MPTLNLTKESPFVDLRKSDSRVTDGQVRIFTGWDRVPREVDLDQGFLVESLTGQKTCVQAVGDNFGSQWQFPFLELQGDDRVGGKGETILGSYASMLTNLKRVSLFLYNYKGDEPLSGVEGAYTEIEVPGFRPVRVTHEEQRTRTCAILQLVNTGDGFRIEREMYSVPSVRGSSPQQELDKHWGYGLRWSPASK
jgi:tellurite resistance protein TerA